MKILFSIAVVMAVLWTLFVLFANMMKPAETGGFIGGNTLVVIWLAVGVLGVAWEFG